MSMTTSPAGAREHLDEDPDPGLVGTLHELWEDASDASLVIDDDGCCGYANPAFTRAFGEPEAGPRRLPMLTVESELLLLRTIDRLRRPGRVHKAELHIDVLAGGRAVGARAVVVRVTDGTTGTGSTVVQLHPPRPAGHRPPRRVLLPAAPRTTEHGSERPAGRDDVDLELRIRELTPRELEVVSLLRLGHRVSTIATTLFISPHTVRNHVKATFRKLDVHSQAELVALFHGRE